MKTKQTEDGNKQAPWAAADPHQYPPGTCIGVDFDGTLARCDGSWRANVFGPPVPAMVERVRGWIRDGVRVVVFTAREQFEHGSVSAWCLIHVGRRLQVTSHKSPAFEAFYDDRAHRVERNTGKIV